MNCSRKIVFYDNRVVDVRSRQRDDGKYEVEIDYSAAKHAADGLGRETDLPLDDTMQVGVFFREDGADESTEKVLYLEAHRIEAPSGTIRVVVDTAPYEVGLDPYNKLIDRIPIDNRKTID